MQFQVLITSATFFPAAPFSLARNFLPATRCSTGTQERTHSEKSVLAEVSSPSASRGQRKSEIEDHSRDVRPVRSGGP